MNREYRGALDDFPLEHLFGELKYTIKANAVRLKSVNYLPKLAACCAKQLVKAAWLSAVCNLPRAAIFGKYKKDVYD